MAMMVGDSGNYEQPESWWDPYEATQVPPKTPQQLADEMRAAMNANGTNPNQQRRPGYQDIEYWREQGVGEGDIFDTNTGQIKPGWQRTANGYERIAEQRDLNERRTDTGGAGGGGGGINYGGVGGDAPMLAYPGYESPGSFTFDPYRPSSWADAENEPGYAASRAQLKKQVEAGAAHRGVLRSGMTIGDLYSNLDALSQQNFKQFDDRNFRNWAGNRDLAATQYGFRAQDVDRKNNYQFNTADASFKDALARWQTMVGSLTTLARPVD